ncbi:hypothetical protein BH09MYX1_BH09MYX1_67430 [soil metagenome]
MSRMGLESASADLAKTYGEENRCPACGAFARIDRDDTFRFVCAVCGAPRIGGAINPSEATNKSLVVASRSKRSAFAWRAASFALGIPAALTLALAAILAPQSFLAAGVLIAGGVLLAIFAARSARLAATEKKKLFAAWSEAWENAALAVLDARGDERTTADDVAKALDLPPAEAEVLLNKLSAQSSVRVRISEDDAKLVYESESSDGTANAFTDPRALAATALDTAKTEQSPDLAAAEAEALQAQAEEDAAEDAAEDAEEAAKAKS